MRLSASYAVILVAVAGAGFFAALGLGRTTSSEARRREPVDTRSVAIVTFGLRTVSRLSPAGTLPDLAPVLSAVELSPAVVVAGSQSTGTIMLTGPARGHEAVVFLSSSTPAVVSAPASVAVRAGETSAVFAATTGVVAATTTVTIEGTFGGVRRSASLTVRTAPPIVTTTPPTSTSGGSQTTPRTGTRPGTTVFG